MILFLLIYPIVITFFHVNALDPESMPLVRHLKPKQDKTAKSKTTKAKKKVEPNIPSSVTELANTIAENPLSNVIDVSVNLLIKWKVIEDFDENNKLDYLENNKKNATQSMRFSDILKRKTFLMNQTSTVANHLYRILEEVDDRDVKVTVDIPPVGITAVQGPVSYFEVLELQHNVAVDMIELDSVKGLINGETEKLLPINDTGRLLKNLQFSEEEPYGIKLTQASSVPVSEYFMKGCVVDTGYDDGHPDLPSSIHPKHHVQGTGQEYEENWYDDFHGHGTHVTGTMFAIRNDIGVIGVNGDPTKVGVVIGKGLDRNGLGFSSVVIDNIYRCYLEGAKVINLSLGGDTYSEIEKQFYDDINNKNILISAAAGNNGRSGIATYWYPASYSSVISVASVDSNLERSDFSNFNDQVEIAAPGYDIISTYPGNKLRSGSGTSMAAPHIAGILLKVWAHFPQCSNTQIRYALMKSASLNKVCNNELGFGVVQAKAMYDNLSKYGCDYGGSQNEWDKISTMPSALVSGGCNGIKYFDLSSPIAASTYPPTNSPTDNPTVSPTVIPTNTPTSAPTKKPTNAPTDVPTKPPIFLPTDYPTVLPTNVVTESTTTLPTIRTSRRFNKKKKIRQKKNRKKRKPKVKKIKTKMKTKSPRKLYSP